MCIHEMFERQAELHPDAIAVVLGDSRLSYRERLESANQLAAFLLERGLVPETLVGVRTERKP